MRSRSALRVTLRAARAAADASGVVAFGSLIPLSLLAIFGLAAAPFSRRFGLKVMGLPAGRALLVFYVCWMALIDRNVGPNGGRPIRWLRFNWLSRRFRSYFRAAVTYDFGPDELVLDRNKTYVLGIHPHGVASLGMFCNSIFYQLLPSFNYRICTIQANMYIPFWRDVLLGFGFVDSNRGTIKSLLSKGISVGIVVGGADEALNARPHTADLTLETRLGFIRIALEHGASLIPIYTFGENETFKQLWPNPPESPLRTLQDSLKQSFGYSMPAVMPDLLQPTLKLQTVVGRPLELPRIEQPSLEQVLEWHRHYVEALQQLFDKYQPQMAPETMGGITFADASKRVAIAKL